MSFFDTLPNEIVLAILSRLGPRDYHACSLVNHQFHMVANPFLWQALSVDSKKRFDKLINGMDSVATETLSPLGSLIRHVHLESFLTDQQFLAFMKHVRNVEDLFLQDAVNITDASARQLSTYCPHVKHLNISYSRITKESLHGLSDCYQLSKLVLLSCPGIQFNSLNAIAACPLKTLMAHACGDVNMNQKVNEGDDDNTMNETGNGVEDDDDVEDDDMEDDDVEDDESVDDIDEFMDFDDDEFMDDEDDDGDRGINDHALQLAGQRTISESVLDIVGFQNLTSLVLLHCPAPFVNSLFTTLVTTTPVIWPHMKKLTLNGFTSLDDGPVLSFIRARRCLTVLVLERNSLTDHFLDEVGSILPALRTLGLSGSKHVSADGLLGLIHQCADLEQVFLADCEITVDEFPEARQANLDENNEGFLYEMDPFTIHSIRLRLDYDMENVDHDLHGDYDEDSGNSEDFEDVDSYYDGDSNHDDDQE